MEMEPPDYTAKERRRARRWLWGSAAGLVVFALTALTGYWWHCQAVPAYTPPAVAMPSPNAFDDYVAATALLPSTPVGARNNKDYYEGSLAELRQRLEAYAPALARLRKGFPHEYRNPPSYSFNDTFPWFAAFRELARDLRLEGRVAELEGRWDDAVQSYLDCLRLGVDVPRGGSLIHALVGIAIQSIAVDALHGVVEHLDAETALRTARQIERLRKRSVTLPDILAGERDASYAGLIDWMRTDGDMRAFVMGFNSFRTGDSLTVDELMTVVRYQLTPKTRIAADFRAYYDQMIADARLPWHQKGTQPVLPSDPMSQLLLPAFTGVRENWTSNEARWKIMTVQLAERAYRLRNGAPPPSLQALVPGYLPEVPQDPYAPQPLVYRPKVSRSAESTTPWIYSRGPNMIDDGGRSAVNQGGVGDDVLGRPARRAVR